ncbi:MAG: hypothetical protein MJE68_24975 [Proteobacteria bacterium]|nr:hypothetical protein [Pseudomonadota bacterium]
MCFAFIKVIGTCSKSAGRTGAGTRPNSSTGDRRARGPVRTVVVRTDGHGSRPNKGPV